MAQEPNWNWNPEPSEPLFQESKSGLSKRCGWQTVILPEWVRVTPAGPAIFAIFVLAWVWGAAASPLFLCVEWNIRSFTDLRQNHLFSAGHKKAPFPKMTVSTTLTKEEPELSEPFFRNPKPEPFPSVKLCSHVFGGSQKGGFQMGGFGRCSPALLQKVFPCCATLGEEESHDFNWYSRPPKNRNEDTFAKTALLQNRPSVSSLSNLKRSVHVPS